MPSPRRSKRTKSKKQQQQHQQSQASKSRRRKSNVKRKKTLAKNKRYTMDQLTSRFAKVGSRKKSAKATPMGMASLLTAIGEADDEVRNPFRRSQWVKRRTSAVRSKRRSKRRKTVKARRQAYVQKRRRKLMSRKSPGHILSAPSFVFNR